MEVPKAVDIGGRDQDVHRSHARVGVYLVAATAAGVSAYMMMTPSGPNRTALWLMIGSQAASVVAIPLLLRAWLANGRNAGWFFGSWSTFAVISIIAAAFLDGGAASPIVSTLAVPMVFAAVLYPPRGVMMVGAAVQIGLFALYLFAPPPGPHPLAALPAFSAVDLTVAFSGAMVARIAQQQLAQEQRLTMKLRELALVDGLTGCLNHRAFQERLHVEVDDAARTNAPVAVILADVDYFKQVNDVHGHPVGDLVLASVAQALRQQLRRSDVVGRLGGEEFAVLMVGVDLDEAMVMAERLRSSVEARSGPVAVTISLGVCSLSPAAASATALIAAADQALYTAKRNGRNRVVSGSSASVVHAS